MVEGRITLFFATILICGAILLQIQKAKKGKEYQLRPMPALDAIDEAIGRAVEMGKTVHYTPGVGNLTTSSPPVMFAALDVLSSVAERAARMDVGFITTTAAGDVQTVSEEIVRSAYSKVGKADAYKIENVRYLSTDQWAYASEVAKIVQTEGVQANILIGHFAASTLVIAESGYLAGAIQVAGTTNTFQMPFFIAACDYVLIGQEVLAASAYLSEDPVTIGSLVGEDFGKVLCLALIFLGVILNTFNITFLNDLITR
ncbi:MAG: DUF6754 domain-containing protein [Bacillota bacterium]|jgi:hypothetical protein